ncbi:hypothetical protein CF319_g6311 [Tilletia indica]|nr:hypothetical protein CF319_g6311 [Tilletia indica]
MTVTRAPHAPPTRTKKRHLSRSNDQQEQAQDPAILALQQAQNQSHNISSSRDASEEDNDDDDQDSLDDDDEEEDHDHQDNAQQQGEGTQQENGDAIKTKLSKADRAARRAAARRHPSSDDADVVPTMPTAATTAGTLALGGAQGPASANTSAAPNAGVAAGEASTVSPSRRASTHAHRERDPQAQISNTLAYASAALHQHSVNSSSASNGDEEDGDRTSSSASFQNQGEVPASTLLARRAPGTSSSSSGPTASEAQAGNKLHLGALPEVKSEDIAASDAPLTVTSQGSNSLAAPASANQTPKIQTASTSAGAPLSVLSPIPGSAPSPPAAAARGPTSSTHKKTTTTLKTRSGVDENEDGEDPLTDGAGGTPYDGDVEGPNPTASKAMPTSATQPTASPNTVPFPVGPPITSSSSSNNNITTGPGSAAHFAAQQVGGSAPNDTILTLPTGQPRQRARLRSDASDKEHAILSAPKSPEEIRAYIRDCIWGERAKGRGYKINEPRNGGGTRERPIRIYADGVFDMFHYAHTLLLRQCKLFFPHVHMIAGVNSSTLCAEHKNRPLLSSEERYASVASCKWVDEVVVDAPWFITPEFIEAHKIDYVAHDDLPYANASLGTSDVYGWLKEAGIFLPTLRTEGVSTSELLGRVVEVYQTHALDDKLRKVGLEKLIDSRSPSGQTSPHHPAHEHEHEAKK